MKTKFKLQMIVSVFFIISLCLLPEISNAQLGKLPKVKSPITKKTEENTGSSETSTPSGPAITSSSANTPAANKAFTENKDDIDSCRKYLGKFNNERQNDNVIAMSNNINSIISQGEKIISDINANIPDIAAFENANEDAKMYHLKSKIGWLQSDIEKAKTRFADLKPYMLKEIKSNVEWLGMPEATIQYAPKAFDEMNNYYALLDKFFPGDPDVEASKNTDIPKAQKQYDRLMKDVAKNRMPTSKYTGGDKASLEKQLSAAYTKRYTTDVVKRVVITDPSWTKKTELYDNNTKVYWRTSSYIGANVAVQKDKTCKVYIVTFRKDTSTGEIELYSVGSNYPVLIENIHK